MTIFDGKAAYKVSLRKWNDRAMRYDPDIAPDILAPYTLGNNEYGVSRVKSCDKCISALKDITQGEGDWAYDETPQFLVDPGIISDEMKLPYDKCCKIA